MTARLRFDIDRRLRQLTDDDHRVCTGSTGNGERPDPVRLGRSWTPPLTNRSRKTSHFWPDPERVGDYTEPSAAAQQSAPATNAPVDNAPRRPRVRESTRCTVDR